MNTNETDLWNLTDLGGGCYLEIEVPFANSKQLEDFLKSPDCYLPRRPEDNELKFP